MIIIGIDPSLTGTGIARVDTDDRLAVDTQTIKSTGRKDATLDQRQARLHNLRLDIGLACHPTNTPLPDLVVIETPSLGQQRQGGTLDRHGLFWYILDWFTTYDRNPIPVVGVSPAQVKKYATGKGNADKDTVLLAVARRFPHVDVTDNNQADALVLAAMGADHHGHPLVELPKVHREALKKVAWPVPVGSVPAAQDLMAGADL